MHVVIVRRWTGCSDNILIACNYVLLQHSDSLCYTEKLFPPTVCFMSEENVWLGHKTKNVHLLCNSYNPKSPSTHSSVIYTCLSFSRVSQRALGSNKGTVVLWGAFWRHWLHYFIKNLPQWKKNYWSWNMLLWPLQVHGVFIGCGHLNNGAFVRDFAKIRCSINYRGYDIVGLIDCVITLQYYFSFCSLGAQS